MEATTYWNGSGSALSDYLARISNHHLLSPAEERELGRRIQNGDEEAWRKLVECNLRLVVSLGRPYARRGALLNDVIQAGNIGLMRAARSFDPDKGNRFATYAGWWIKQAIQRALPDEVSTIRIPEHIDREQRQGVVQHNLPHTVSLEAPLGEEGTLSELIPDPKSEDVDQVTAEMTVTSALKHLPDREARVLTMRYGLGCKEYSFTEIGDSLNVTSTRARQLHDRALKSLRGSLAV